MSKFDAKFNAIFESMDNSYTSWTKEMASITDWIKIQSVIYNMIPFDFSEAKDGDCITEAVASTSSHSGFGIGYIYVVLSHPTEWFWDEPESKYANEIRVLRVRVIDAVDYRHAVKLSKTAKERFMITKKLDKEAKEYLINIGFLEILKSAIKEYKIENPAT